MSEHCYTRPHGDPSFFVIMRYGYSVQQHMMHNHWHKYLYTGIVNFFILTYYSLTILPKTRRVLLVQVSIRWKCRIIHSSKTTSIAALHQNTRKQRERERLWMAGRDHVSRTRNIFGFLMTMSYMWMELNLEKSLGREMRSMEDCLWNCKRLGSPLEYCSHPRPPRIRSSDE